MEDNIFTTTIPIPNVDKLQIRDMKKTPPQVTPQVIKLLKVCRGEMSREELLSILELKDREHLRKVFLKPALKLGFIELTIPDKPNSSKQKYRLTEKGKGFLKIRIKQHE